MNSKESRMKNIGLERQQEETEETMRRTDFEEFLQTKHAEQYRGTDDLMPEDYNEWLCELDVDTIIQYAEEWRKTWDTTKK